MIEDKSLNEFIKAKLEEDVGELPSVNVPALVESSASRGWRPFLVAASLVAVCGVFAVHIQNRRAESCECVVNRAIELLDCDSMTADAGSFAERLLAWQDAPFAELAY